jgi:transcriptional regulator with XRE-family HTH domain
MNPQGDHFGARFGDLVRRRRGIEGLTQEALAVRAFPGGETSASQISLIERGKIFRPQQKTVDALAAALDLRPDQIEACRHPDAAILHEVKTTLEQQTAAFADHRASVDNFIALLSNAAFMERAAARGLSVIQVENLLTRFGHAGAPIEQAEKLLLDAADQLDTVRARLALLSETDQSVVTWKREALATIDSGDLDTARTLFRQAADRDLIAVEEIERNRRERRLSAADSVAQIARLESAEAAFSVAAREFESAARIAEPVDLNSAWWHWIDAAEAYARSAEIFPDIAASRAAVDVVRRHSLPLAIATNNPIKLQRARYELAEDLLVLSARVSEDEAVTLRAEALAEARLALDALPTDSKRGLRVSGLTQVGEIELAIARSVSGRAGLVAIRAAVIAFREALALIPTDGTCMMHLGTAVRALADTVPEPEASVALDEAIALYRAALARLPSDAPPEDRAGLSSLLGAAYLAAADRGGANLENDRLQTARTLLEDAVASLDPALRPLSWAQAVGNIAIVERRLEQNPITLDHSLRR